MLNTCMFCDDINFTYLYLHALDKYGIETFGILYIDKDDMIDVIFDVICYMNFECYCLVPYTE